MDISLTGNAQDGQLSDIINGVDCRVASMPSSHGEDIAIRFFKSGQYSPKGLALSELGFSTATLSVLQKSLIKDHGLILMTGPTGTGKTTSLYACLKHIQRRHSGIIATLEDPIEQGLAGIRQSQVNHQSGHNFHQALSALLRQDPDVLMLGEIRDAKSAKIALEAAYTGHLLLSSLHTHDTYSSLLRLKTLGLDLSMLGQVLKLIVSQRLAPKLCQQCRYAVDHGFEARGCVKCQYSGQLGQILIAESRYFDKPFTLDPQLSSNTAQATTWGELYAFKTDIQEKKHAGLISASYHDNL